MSEGGDARSAWQSCVLRATPPTATDFSLFALVFKQIVAAVVGAALGLAGVTGVLGAAVFAVVSVGATFLYAKSYLAIDDDTLENHTMVTEGALPSCALFLLAWTLAFSLRV